MQSASLDGWVAGEYNGVGFVEISGVFVTQGDFFLYSGTIWQRECIHFIPDNADKLNWNKIRGGVLCVLISTTQGMFP